MVDLANKLLLFEYEAWMYESNVEKLEEAFRQWHNQRTFRSRSLPSQIEIFGVWMRTMKMSTSLNGRGEVPLVQGSTGCAD